MRAFLWISVYVFAFVGLTVLTQVGGMVLLGCIPLFRIITRKVEHKPKRRFIKLGSFIAIYLLLTFTLIPLLAALGGRAPLWTLPSNVSSLNVGTVLLNRGYVDFQLRHTIGQAANHLEKEYPGTIIAYLDGNFPFMDGFPLLPHLSHNDGEKLDIAFFYIDRKTDTPLNLDSPSWHGYGVFEGPEDGEEDMAWFCRAEGYWQYSILKYTTFPDSNDEYILDQDRTKELINWLCRQEEVGKIFIEPHLKQRMNLTSDKVRLHGCGAVRHDDHIHVQLR